MVRPHSIRADALDANVDVADANTQHVNEPHEKLFGPARGAISWFGCCSVPASRAATAAAIAIASSSSLASRRLLPCLFTSSLNGCVQGSQVHQNALAVLDVSFQRCHHIQSVQLHGDGCTQQFRP